MPQQQQGMIGQMNNDALAQFLGQVMQQQAIAGGFNDFSGIGGAGYLPQANAQYAQAFSPANVQGMTNANNRAAQVYANDVGAMGGIAGDYIRGAYPAYYQGQSAIDSAGIQSGAQVQASKQAADAAVQSALAQMLGQMSQGQSAVQAARYGTAPAEAAYATAPLQYGTQAYSAYAPAQASVYDSWYGNDASKYTANSNAQASRYAAGADFAKTREQENAKNYRFANGLGFANQFMGGNGGIRPFGSVTTNFGGGVFSG
jgi:hypothetical protein